jgi:conjugative transfer region lipoprotein (TIGR03751 family)
MKVCSNTHPNKGLTVSQLYRKSIPKPVKPRLRRKVGVTHMSTKFKALPNPEVPIYVFAHVAMFGDEQIIKPSYTTRFFLYKQNPYALASELY